MKGSWIWTDKKLPEFNRFVSFRKTFNYKGGKANFKITADTRYVLYINGEYVNYGPGRYWPKHTSFDEYDLIPYLEKGKNVIAVLVNHYNTSTFQYIAGPAGLLCELELEKETILSDSSFKCRPNMCFENKAVRVSCQQGFEEIYNANFDDGWKEKKYNDSNWDNATETGPANDDFHSGFEPKNIPNLSMEIISPKKVVSYECVKSSPYFINLNMKEAVFPNNRNSYFNTANFCVATRITSDRDTKAEIRSVGVGAGTEIYVNGNHCPWTKTDINEEGSAYFTLNKGKNDLIFSFTSSSHHLNFQYALDTDACLAFSSEKGNGKYALIGPFALCDSQEYFTDHYNDPKHLQNICFPENAEVSKEKFNEFIANPLIDTYINTAFYNEIDEAITPEVSPFFISYTDKTVKELSVNSLSYLLGNNTWTEIKPDSNGDVRICLDYGKALTGYQNFEIVSEKDVIVDFHNFEFIQPDGRYNFCEGMTNSFRYITKEGRQSYQTLLRRGFRYSYITFRNLKNPIHIRNINAVYASYQQTNQGSFSCSDYKLTKMWEVGANTMRACAEDTYTDCPTYEQTLWVGDARNEAIVDYTVNGDPRLWFRFIHLTGQSLDRSNITESEVPSGWQDIIPLWTFLWMRSCVEYYRFTDDRKGMQEIMTYLIKNAKGLKSYINEKGLIDIWAWNFFDWAPMDTPSNGATITHNNCFAVLALNETADMAEELGYKEEAQEWKSIAESIKEAINKYMWNQEKQAYTDCLRGDTFSDTYSQQANTAAFISGVAEGERAKRCKDILYNAPEGFVKAGSPFFEFFLLEALQNDNRDIDFLNIIRRDWGFMLDKGATSFWEMWSCGTKEGDRLTRSHCHGWSSAPTYFLTSFVLGIKPAEPGFKRAIINPHFGDLDWARGTMPTKFGNIEVQWKKLENGEYKVDVKSPVPYELIY